MSMGLIVCESSRRERVPKLTLSKFMHPPIIAVVGLGARVLRSPGRRQCCFVTYGQNPQRRTDAQPAEPRRKGGDQLPTLELISESSLENRVSDLLRGGRVKPRIHVITLAVDDLERSLSFYRRLGWESEGIIAEEFPGDEDMAAGAIALFQLDGGLVLCVFPRSELAKDAKVPPSTSAPGEFSIGHAVRSREEVDALLQAAEDAGATVTVRAYDRPFGVYSGYFQDPDGHLWEVLWNPALTDV